MSPHPNENEFITCLIILNDKIPQGSRGWSRRLVRFRHKHVLVSVRELWDMPPRWPGEVHCAIKITRLHSLSLAVYYCFRKSDNHNISNVIAHISFFLSLDFVGGCLGSISSLRGLLPGGEWHNGQNKENKTQVVINWNYSLSYRFLSLLFLQVSISTSATHLISSALFTS